MQADPPARSDTPPKAAAERRVHLIAPGAPAAELDALTRGLQQSAFTPIARLPAADEDGGAPGLVRVMLVTPGAPPAEVERALLEGHRDRAGGRVLALFALFVADGARLPSGATGWQAFRLPERPSRVPTERWRDIGAGLRSARPRAWTPETAPGVAAATAGLDVRDALREVPKPVHTVEWDAPADVDAPGADVATDVGGPRRRLAFGRAAVLVALLIALAGAGWYAGDRMGVWGSAGGMASRDALDDIRDGLVLARAQLAATDLERARQGATRHKREAQRLLSQHKVPQELRPEARALKAEASRLLGHIELARGDEHQAFDAFTHEAKALQRAAAGSIPGAPESLALADSWTWVARAARLDRKLKTDQALEALGRAAELLGPEPPQTGLQRRVRAFHALERGLLAVAQQRYDDAQVGLAQAKALSEPSPGGATGPTWVGVHAREGLAMRRAWEADLVWRRREPDDVPRPPTPAQVEATLAAFEAAEAYRAQWELGSREGLRPLDPVRDLAERGSLRLMHAVALWESGRLPEGLAKAIEAKADAALGLERSPKHRGPRRLSRWTGKWLFGRWIAVADEGLDVGPNPLAPYDGAVAALESEPGSVGAGAAYRLLLDAANVAQMRLDRGADAVRYLDRAEALRPGSTSVACLLAEALLSVGGPSARARAMTPLGACFDAGEESLSYRVVAAALMLVWVVDVQGHTPGSKPLADAVAELDQAVEALGDQPLSWYMRGLRRALQAREQLALAGVLRALRLPSKPPTGDGGMPQGSPRVQAVSAALEAVLAQAAPLERAPSSGAASAPPTPDATPPPEARPTLRPRP